MEKLSPRIFSNPIEFDDPALAQLQSPPEEVANIQYINRNGKQEFTFVDGAKTASPAEPNLRPARQSSSRRKRIAARMKRNKQSSSQENKQPEQNQMLNKNVKLKK